MGQKAAALFPASSLAYALALARNPAIGVSGQEPCHWGIRSGTLPLGYPVIGQEALPLGFYPVRSPAMGIRSEPWPLGYPVQEPCHWVYPVRKARPWLSESGAMPWGYRSGKPSIGLSGQGALPLGYRSGALPLGIRSGVSPVRRPAIGLSGQGVSRSGTLPLGYTVRSPAMGYPVRSPARARPLVSGPEAPAIGLSESGALPLGSVQEPAIGLSGQEPCHGDPSGSLPLVTT
ncbi:hypothetical protein Baya_9873 [Bagarius yarrelli]|uniref:Uncharacterized protein n=1 Tax=Bagarius yarrelli TaxID=175774 RepID=A0A556U8W9_BAGYA|nr:hypothetical protein Baya_9873 [Bagarius yarrelli]